MGKDKSDAWWLWTCMCYEMAGELLSVVSGSYLWNSKIIDPTTGELVHWIAQLLLALLAKVKQKEQPR